MSIDHKIEHIRKSNERVRQLYQESRIDCKTWSALLDLPSPIPPYKVALMYAASKVLEPHSFKKDNYVDALNYLRKAQQIQKAAEDDKDN